MILAGMFLENSREMFLFHPINADSYISAAFLDNNKGKCKVSQYSSLEMPPDAASSMSTQRAHHLPSMLRHFCLTS